MNKTEKEKLLWLETFQEEKETLLDK